MKHYVDNGKFIELVSDIATEFTEQHFYDKTYELAEDGQGDKFTEEAQDFYLQKYDEIEAMINETINVYSDGDKNPRKIKNLPLSEKTKRLIKDALEGNPFINETKINNSLIGKMIREHNNRQISKE